MNKKMLIGVGLVALCLIIGLSQMRGGYCDISLPPDGDRPEAEPVKAISLSEVQKTKEEKGKSSKTAEANNGAREAEAIAVEAKTEKNIAETERAFIEKEAITVIMEESVETKAGLSEADGGPAETGDGPAPFGDGALKTQERLSQDEFLIICATGSIEMIKRAVDSGLDVNGSGPQLKITPLMAAISDKETKRSLAKAKLLVKAGAAPSAGASDDEKQGPLHLAAGKGDSVELLDYLIASGADVNAKDARGFSPLMIAVMSTGILSPQDQLETLKALINAGADLNQTTNNGAAALSLAAINASPKVLRLLIENGAEVNAADNNGRTALMVVVWGNSLEAVKTLLDNGADPNLKDREGLDVLDHTGRHDNPAAEQIRKLLKLVLKR